MSFPWARRVFADTAFSLPVRAARQISPCARPYQIAESLRGLERLTGCGGLPKGAFMCLLKNVLSRCTHACFEYNFNNKWSYAKKTKKNCGTTSLMLFVDTPKLTKSSRAVLHYLVLLRLFKSKFPCNFKSHTGVVFTGQSGKRKPRAELLQFASTCEVTGGCWSSWRRWCRRQQLLLRPVRPLVCVDTVILSDRRRLELLLIY